MGQIFVPASTAPGRLIGFQPLTGAGTYTPSIGARSAQVVAVGAGAGAGGVDGDGVTPAGSNGGGAGGQTQLFMALADDSYPFACGVAGVGGVGTGNGTNGGSTTFGAPAILTAPGGVASPGVDAASGSTSQTVQNNSVTPTGGDINVPGQAGGQAQVLDPISGDFVSGRGGSSPYGTGGALRGIGDEGNGNVGIGFGAGGGGALSIANLNRTGGAGTNGVIFVWEYS